MGSDEPIGRIVHTENRRRIDIIRDEEFLAGLADLDLDALRERRGLSDGLETELSFYRRLLHGRMDLLAFEIRRRSGLETRSLIEALPEILGAGESTSEHIGRLPTNLAPDLPDERRRHIDRVLGSDFLARMPSIEDAELSEIQVLLTDTEREVSEQRKSAQNAFDKLQTEIMRRYKEGLADDTDLLSS